MNQLLVIDVADGAATGRQAAVLGQADHALSFIAQSLGTGFGGGNPTLADQLGGETPQHGFALVGGASQHGDSALVSHWADSGEKAVGKRGRRSGASAALGQGDADALQRFDHLVG